MTWIFALYLLIGTGVLAWGIYLAGPVHPLIGVSVILVWPLFFVFIVLAVLDRVSDHHDH